MSKMATFRRLPDTVVPRHYDLRLRTDLDRCNFDGNVSIRIDVVEDAREIRLHSLGLKIVTVELREGEGATARDISWELSEATEEMVVTAKDGSLFAAGIQVNLAIVYKGKLGDDMRGFYRTKRRGSTKFGGVTHFEASDARRAFPCFDEPRFRATLGLRMESRRNVGLTVLSNMPEKERIVMDEEWEAVVFDTLPPTPTYLMAWTVGEYACVEGKTALGIPVRVFSDPGREEEGRFALTVAVGALELYADFFATAYHLPKMDLLSVPDFPIGAMENWGLLTFREDYLLVDEKKSSAGARQDVALVVAHEVAHQWFGNLVTIHWWTHLWLKEGYATWIEYLCVDRLFPRWEIWKQFLASTAQTALRLDSLENTHPVEVEVENPAQIDEIFDAISYNKGAGIIRMLFQWLGEDAFKRGMFSYLKEKALLAAATEDLWRSLAEASRKPVAEVMSAWTLGEGFPLLSVVSCENNCLKLRQSRFMSAGGDGGRNPEKNPIWSIPFSITCQSSPHEPIYHGIMAEHEQTVDLPSDKTNEWLNLNPKGVGFYRVLYTDQLHSRLTANLASLSAEDRLSLLADKLSLAESGKTPTVELLKMMEQYREDRDVVVWQTMHICLTKLRELIWLRGEPDAAANFDTWSRWLLSPSITRLGYTAGDGDDHLTKLFRALIVDNLVMSGNLECSEMDSLTPDLLTSVYSARLKRFGHQEFEKLEILCREATSGEEQVRVLEAMGAASTEPVLLRALQLSLSDAVRSQDTRFVVNSVAKGSAMGRDLAWRFFKDNEETFRKRYEKGGLLTKLVRTVTEGFGTVDMAKEVETYFEKHPFAGAQRTVKQSVENILLRAAWDRRDGKSIVEYIRVRSATQQLP